MGRTAEDEPPELGDAAADSLRQRLGTLPPDLVLGDVQAGRQACATTAPQLCFWRAPSGLSGGHIHVYYQSSSDTCIMTREWQPS